MQRPDKSAKDRKRESDRERERERDRNTPFPRRKDCIPRVEYSFSSNKGLYSTGGILAEFRRKDSIPRLEY